MISPSSARFAAVATVVAVALPIAGASGVAAQPAFLDADVTCDPADQSQNAVVEARMGWGVRDSFRTYVSGSIANGGWTTEDGAVFSDGDFVFDGDEGTVSTDGGVLAFTGSVNFTGHDGVLDTTIADPEVRWEGDEGALVAEVTSNDTDGDPHNYGRIEVADLAVEQGENSGGAPGTLQGDAEVSLTADGSTAMGDFYEEGAIMDPLTFRAALSDGCSGEGEGLDEEMPEDEGDGSGDEGAQADGEVTIRDDGSDDGSDDGNDGADSADSDDTDENPVVNFLTTPATAIPGAVVLVAVIVGAWFGLRRWRA